MSKILYFSSFVYKLFFHLSHSECHHGHDWVKVWLHTGHLHIRGRKMSKSLKNFVSIQEYFQQQLTSSPSDDFRIFCLQHKYSALLTYAPERILEAASFRNKLVSFYQQVDSLMLRIDSQPQHHVFRKPTKESITLQQKLFALQQQIPRSLANDFDTPTVLQMIGSIVGDSIQYLTIVDDIKSHHAGVNHHSIEPLMNVVSYTKSILSKLGLLFPNQIIGAKSQDQSFQSTAQELDLALDAAIQLRTNARNIAVQGIKLLKAADQSANQPLDLQQVKGHFQALLQHCDQTRDALSEKLNIQIDDLKNSGSTWRRKT
jgi:cysteinyl-tRNA synthetase